MALADTCFEKTYKFYCNFLAQSTHVSTLTGTMNKHLKGAVSGWL